MDSLVGQYEGKIKAQASELKEVKRRALDEAQRIVANANAVIERSVREIRETSAEKTAVRRLREDVDRLKEEIRQEEQTVAVETSGTEAEPIDTGSTVRLTAGTDTGEVLSITADRSQAIVVFGQVKMKVPLKDLVPVREAGRARARFSAAQVDLRKQVARELDVRGMTGEEALPLIDKFIDDAVLAGLHRIDIIHGKGTGALRKRVTEFLTGYPRVKSFHIAEWNEGGMGATVVELGDS